jgi:hypothetical protein
MLADGVVVVLMKAAVWSLRAAEATRDYENDARVGMRPRRARPSTSRYSATARSDGWMANTVPAVTPDNGVRAPREPELSRRPGIIGRP